MTVQFKVSSMVCEHCAAAITKAIKNLESSADVRIDLETKTVYVDAEVPSESIQQAIIAAGHIVD